MNAYIILDGRLVRVIIKTVYPSDGRHEAQAYIVSADGAEIFPAYSMGGPMMRSYATVRMSQILEGGECFASNFSSSVMEGASL